MAIVTWTGATSGSLTTTGNWLDGALPVANDHVVVPSWATNGMTSNLNWPEVALSSFHVQAGFTKNIGVSASGSSFANSFLEVSLAGTNADLPQRFTYEGTGNLARIHIKASTANTSYQVLNTGSGANGHPALQLMSDNLAAMGDILILRGEVSLGPEGSLLDVDNIIVGSPPTSTGLSSSSARVWIGSGVNAVDDSDLETLTVSSGTVSVDCNVDTINLHGGNVLQTSGNVVTALNLYTGGVYEMANPQTTGSVHTVAKLNLYGGTLTNERNPTAKTITASDLYSGTILDPAAKLTWGDSTVYKGKATDVNFDFGPNRTIRIT